MAENLFNDIDYYAQTPYSTLIYCSQCLANK